jgi:hypothetical protein
VKVYTGYGAYGLKDAAIRRLTGRRARWEEAGIA